MSNAESTQAGTLRINLSQARCRPGRSRQCGCDPAVMLRAVPMRTVVRARLARAHRAIMGVRLELHQEGAGEHIVLRTEPASV